MKKGSIRKSFVVKESMVDCFGRLSYFEFFKMIENVAGVHAEKMGLGMGNLMRIDNATWVISKIRIEFENFDFAVGDRVDIDSFILKPTLIKNERFYKVWKNKKEVARIYSVWCIINKDTRKPLRSVEIQCLQNNEIKFSSKGLNIKFSNVQKDDFAGSEVAEKRVVKFTDLDINNHLNNCVYTKFVLDVLGRDFFENHFIQNYEIHFLKEAHFNDELEIFKKCEGDKILVFGKIKDEVIFVVQIDAKKR